jgi:hypothetical protein
MLISSSSVRQTTGILRSIHMEPVRLYGNQSARVQTHAMYDLMIFSGFIMTLPLKKVLGSSMSLPYVEYILYQKYENNTS